MSVEFKPQSLPVLPLRDVVVYPHMVIPLFVGRPKSIKALEAAMEGNKQVLLVAQKSAAQDDPKPDDIYTVGTLSNILQILKLPDGPAARRCRCGDGRGSPPRRARRPATCG